MHVNDSPGRPILVDTPKDSPSSACLGEPMYVPPPSGATTPDRNYPEPALGQNPTRTDRVKSRLGVFLKKFLIFMVSHVGLTCLVVGYSIMGGFIFMRLEAAQAVESRAVIGEIRQSYVRQLWDVTQDLNVLYQANWTARADDLLKGFQFQVFETVKSTGWDGSDSVTEESVEWTYAGSLLYSVTVITTIGYGHLTPRTTWGRLVTILYALVGIPLTLLCLANIGSFMAKCFRLFWKKVLCRLCLKSKSRPADTRRRKSQREITSTKDNDMTNPQGDDDDDDDGQLKGVAEYSADVKDPVVRIPIYVCLFLLTGYISLGAMLFTFWEDWSYLEGTYFCFITLSTIGFGDYVPGQSRGSWHDQAKRVSCTLYLLYGLALISMCFDLMQCEVKMICRDIMRSMGLSKPDGENV